jgi:PAS domain S-box-containing protein
VSNTAANAAANATSGATSIECALAPYADDVVGVSVHRNGVVLGANPAFADMFAVRPPDEPTGMRILDFVAPEARPRVAALIAAPPDHPVTYDCLRLDGIPLIVRGEGRSIELADGPARITVLTPLTDGAHTVDQVDESSELFHLAFERAPSGKALVSPEGRILYVNPKLCALLGRPAQELLGQPYDAMSYDDDRELGLQQAIALLLGDGDTYEIEKRYVHADGRVVWVSIAVALVRTRDGAPRYFVAQVLDVTERRRTEDALHRETARLRLMQTVAEAANSTEDPDDAYATAMAAVCGHTGWTLAHVYRRTPADDALEPSELWHVEDRTHDFGDFVRATAQTRLTTGIGLPGITVAARRATWLPAPVTTERAQAAARAGIRGAVALPVFADGEIVAVLEFFSLSADEPDEALLELLGHVGTQIGRVAERAHARAQAAALDEARSRFVANAAHELRTPLATLRTIAGLLGSRRTEMSEADIAECCELLERQGANLDALVDDLLDLSRLQQSARPEALTPVAVDDWVYRALEVALPPEGVTITLGLGAGLRVLAEPDRLNRALVNLLANAYRHGGPNVTVRAERDGDGSVLVMVEDDGDGVPVDLVPHLFEPFSRSDRSDGTGLGLAITRALVEQSGGSVTYQARPGRGARFVLRSEACP